MNVFMLETYGGLSGCLKLKPESLPINYLILKASLNTVEMLYSPTRAEIKLIEVTYLRYKVF